MAQGDIKSVWRDIGEVTQSETFLTENANYKITYIEMNGDGGRADTASHSLVVNHSGGTYTLYSNTASFNNDTYTRTDGLFLEPGQDLTWDTSGGDGDGFRIELHAIEIK